MDSCPYCSNSELIIDRIVTFCTEQPVNIVNGKMAFSRGDHGVERFGDEEEQDITLRCRHCDAKWLILSDVGDDGPYSQEFYIEELYDCTKKERIVLIQE